MPSVGLLLPTLADTPNLPGAACVDHRELFDACIERGASLSYPLAIKVCLGRPALTPCRCWVTSLPVGRRPLGVTGRLVRTGRTKRDAA
jgi:hypothetical protein